MAPVLERGEDAGLSLLALLIWQGRIIQMGSRLEKVVFGSRRRGNVIVIILVADLRIRERVMRCAGLLEVRVVCNPIQLLKSRRDG